MFVWVYASVLCECAQNFNHKFFLIFISLFVIFHLKFIWLYFIWESDELFTDSRWENHLVWSFLIKNDSHCGGLLFTVEYIIFYFWILIIFFVSFTTKHFCFWVTRVIYLSFAYHNNIVGFVKKTKCWMSVSVSVCIIKPNLK